MSLDDAAANAAVLDFITMVMGQVHQPFDDRVAYKIGMYYRHAIEALDFGDVPPGARQRVALEFVVDNLVLITEPNRAKTLRDIIAGER